jgi:hypothetical protein
MSMDIIDWLVSIDFLDRHYPEGSTIPTNIHMGYTTFALIGYSVPDLSASGSARRVHCIVTHLNRPDGAYQHIPDHDTVQDLWLQCGS